MPSLPVVSWLAALTFASASASAESGATQADRNGEAYAYVVDYRPLDLCSPPACQLVTSKLVGWWDEVQNDGDRGGYARFGDADGELYFRRAVGVRPGDRYQVTLPAKAGTFEFDAFLAALDGELWSGTIEAVLPDGRVAFQQDVEGYTEPFVDAPTSEEMGDYAEYFTHVRLPLPARTEPLTLRIRNTGESVLALGSPLVLGRVARRARQVVMVVIDAVPEPLFSRMFTGSGDERTEWLAEALREHGTLLAQGTSPGFNTPTFIRRFFRAGYYETDGDIGLFGQGIDEALPPTPPSPISRLVESGVQAELTIANFLLLPSHVAFGFDGGYHSERQDAARFHLDALPHRFADWAHERAHDDAFHSVWFTATHTPYPPGRDAPPFDLRAPSGLEFSQKTLDAVWRNLLSSIDSLKRLMDSAQRAAPDVDRVWVVMADHGRTFTDRSMTQFNWLPPSHVGNADPEHCCLASFEETHAPVAVIYDGAPRLAPERLERPTSNTVIWRLVEQHFGVDVKLPDTSSFDSPELDPERFAARWDDEILVSAGDAGALRARSGNWALRSLRISERVGTVWNRSDRMQLNLTGSPNRTGGFLAEELYDRTIDPFEQKNVADRHPDVVLELRAQMTNWLATYYDPPSHPRYRYELTFPKPVTIGLHAPKPFKVGVDGTPVTRTRGTSIDLSGTHFVFEEDEAPIGVLDVEGAELGRWLRCANTGLPLAKVETVKTRFNFILARTNCVSPPVPGLGFGPGDVTFRAELLREQSAGGGNISSQELMEGLRRWGYVRDLDKSKRP